MKSATVCDWPRVHIPDSCRNVEIFIGIDEAGRGPVLGSLVYCAAFWPASEHEAICKLGFDDSKQLKEGERDRLFDKIRAHPSIGWVIEEMTAQELSSDMLRASPVSLNAISYDAVIRALEIIRDGRVPTSSSRTPAEEVNKKLGTKECSLEAPIVTDVFIDTVGDPAYYKSRLVQALGEDYGNFTIEKKADATYRVVSAASIIAKVTRDRLLKDWVWTESSVTLNKEFGSGYPGDEHCVKWLAGAQNQVFGFPDLVRFSWSTAKNALEAGCSVKITWDCDDEDTAGSETITNYFNLSGEKRPKRSAFYTQRKMKHVLPSDLE